MNFKRITMAKGFCQLSVNLTTNVTCNLNFWSFCQLSVTFLVIWQLSINLIQILL